MSTIPRGARLGWIGSHKHETLRAYTSPETIVGAPDTCIIRFIVLLQPDHATSFGSLRAPNSEQKHPAILESEHEL